ncbi:phage holin [Propionimicrobium lymphophilum]|uniref:phage holin n=1 Tax=Propionimicrobium lymphophilum TaxID=33012 RepID=UPI003EC5C0AC
MTPQLRQAIYTVLAAITPLAVAYGLMTPDQSALWLALGSAVLNAAALLLARKNTPTGASEGPPPKRAAI